jgi:hypothetical protein
MSYKHKILNAYCITDIRVFKTAKELREDPKRADTGNEKATQSYQLFNDVYGIPKEASVSTDY